MTGHTASASDPAFPVQEAPMYPGLTKREYFAAMAMQGVVAANDPDLQAMRDIARYALRVADAMLEALSDEDQNHG